MSFFILKFLKYCCVGATGMAVDFGITFLLKEKLATNPYLANSAGFLLAASSNFFLNRFWTFEESQRTIVTAYPSFLTIALIGLQLNNLLLFLFTKKMAFSFYAAKFIAIILITLWNFLMNYFITF